MTRASAPRTGRRTDGGSRRRWPGTLLAVVMLLAPLASAPAHAATDAPAAAEAALEVTVVGDFGMDDANEAAVATMIGTWAPAMVVTTGDNYYLNGPETGPARFDRTVGKYYCAFLRDAFHGPGCPSGGTSPVNRFFPATGNHDYDNAGIANFDAAFTLPGAGVDSPNPTGSERYYDVRNGPAHFFFIDSEGALRSSTDATTQRNWLQSALAGSNAPWKIVVFHHPPYSSSANHGSTTAMQWPFASWGVDLVLNGHDHTYERVERDGVSYIVNGLGGAARYGFGPAVTGSTARYNAAYAAQRLTITAGTLTSELVAVDGTVVDRFTRTASAGPTVTPLAAASKFVGTTPTRVLDTRLGLGAPTGRVAPGGTVRLPLAGVAGMPGTGVTAVALNATLDDATGPGFVQVLPTGRASIGDSSNLNVEAPGTTIANLAIVPVGDGGAVSLHTQGGGHLIADLLGWFVASPATSDGRYVAVTPARVLDTRTGFGTAGRGAGRVPAGSSIAVTVRGAAGVPATGVSVVALNVTATEAEPGYLQVLAGDSGRTGAWSNLNVRADAPTTPNLVLVPVGADGTIRVHAEHAAHVLVDVLGWFTDSTRPVSGAGRFVPVRPLRVLDTRTGTGAITKPISRGASALLGLRIEPTVGSPGGAAAALVVGLTATETIAPGYVQLLPTGEAAVGSSSTVNAPAAGRTVANSTVATLAASGELTLYSEAGTHAILDVVGYLTRA